MKAWAKVQLLKRIIRWRMAFGACDLDFKPSGRKGTRFISAREAAAMVPDSACVLSTGMAGNGRCKIFYYALRDRFRRSGHPRDLTWMAVGAVGGRGRVAGTVEDLALPGLIARYIGGHLETVKALRAQAERGELEMQTIPQGVMAFLIEGQGRGGDSILSRTGVGTFLDPALGGGTQVVPGVGQSLVARENEHLRYNLPKVQVALLMASSADEEGNIYMDSSTTLTENLEGARAARRNGGKVLVGVGGIVPKNEGAIFLRADEVDGVVVDRFAEQTACYFQRDPWKALTVGSDEPLRETVQRVAFINKVLGITPRRGAADRALARMAADVFSRVVRPGALVNIGVGLPEEVCREIAGAGLAKDVTFLVETGALGGLPAAGVFFGAAMNPVRLLTSAEAFHLCEDRLDVSVLGFLQVDTEGNVNVSRRGPGPTGFVGPGGFPDIATSARTLIFVGTWMAGARLSVDGRCLNIRQPGAHKFVPLVDEITLNGREALRRGQNVWFVTNVGILRLTEKGMELAAVAPGVDVQRDLVEACAMPILAPPQSDVPVIPSAIMTGEGFCLAWHESTGAPARDVAASEPVGAIP